ANRVVAHRGQLGDERIVVGDMSSALQKELHDFESRRFTRVIHVLLVRNTENTDSASLDRLLLVVERVCDAVDDVFGHGGIDFAGEFDEARMDSVLARDPGEVKGIDGDAMPT